MTDETMSSTGSDVNYLLWAVEGAFVSDATYDYMKKSKTSQYNKYNLSPYPKKNGVGLKEQLVGKSSIQNVDTVTKATITSRAIVDSVDQSIVKAERGQKDDPAPELPKPDTSEAIVPADGLYLAKGSCIGADLGMDGRVLLESKNGKLTARLFYIEQRQSSYPNIFPGTWEEGEAAASKLKADLDTDLLADQAASSTLLKSDEMALFDTLMAVIDKNDAGIRANSLLNSKEVKDAVSGKADYTTASYKAFADAKAALEAALKDETKTADDIDDALHSLRDALSKLEKKTASKLTVKGANKTFKAAVLKKKAQSYKAVTVKKAAGKVTCTAKGVNGKSKKALKFSAKTGKITVKKGTKKGTYKMKVTVKDAGSAKVKGATKTVTCTVKVK